MAARGRSRALPERSPSPEGACEGRRRGLTGEPRVPPCLFERWVLDVVFGGVGVGELVHDVEAVRVRVVDLDEGLPLVRERVLRENRFHRALGLACPAVDALLGIDDEDA